MKRVNKESQNPSANCGADRAAQAMREYPGYKEIMGDLPGDEAHIDCTVELVTDLLHLAKTKWNADPDYILRVARDHIQAEKRQEG